MGRALDILNGGRGALLAWAASFLFLSTVLLSCLSPSLLSRSPSLCSPFSPRASLPKTSHSLGGAGRIPAPAGRRERTSHNPSGERPVSFLFLFGSRVRHDLVTTLISPPTSRPCVSPLAPSYLSLSALKAAAINPGAALAPRGGRTTAAVARATTCLAATATPSSAAAAGVSREKGEEEGGGGGLPVGEQGGGGEGGREGEEAGEDRYLHVFVCV